MRPYPYRREYRRPSPWPWRLWWALVVCGLGLFLYALQGCATVRNIPANSTPQREVRYLRTRDAANLALGAACDQAVALVVRDTAPLAQLAGVAVCGAGALVQRQTDRGYRESGALFVMSGATLRRLLLLFLRAVR